MADTLAKINPLEYIMPHDPVPQRILNASRWFVVEVLELDFGDYVGRPSQHALVRVQLLSYLFSNGWYVDAVQGGGEGGQWKSVGNTTNTSGGGTVTRSSTSSTTQGDTRSQTSGATSSETSGGTRSQTSGGTRSQTSGATNSQTSGATNSQTSGGTRNTTGGGTRSTTHGGSQQSATSSGNSNGSSESDSSSQSQSSGNAGGGTEGFPNTWANSSGSANSHSAGRAGSQTSESTHTNTHTSSSTQSSTSSQTSSSTQSHTSSSTQSHTSSSTQSHTSSSTQSHTSSSTQSHTSSQTGSQTSSHSSSGTVSHTSSSTTTTGTGGSVTENEGPYWFAYIRIRLKRRKLQAELVMKDMVEDLIKAHNEGRKVNDERYDELVKLYAMLLGRTENEGNNFIDATADLKPLTDYVLLTMKKTVADFHAVADNLPDDVFKNRVREINLKFDNQLSTARVELITAGLFNSTVWTTTASGIERNREMALNDLIETKIDVYVKVAAASGDLGQKFTDAAAKLQNMAKDRLLDPAKTRSEVFKWMLEFMERRKDEFPSLEQVVGAAKQLGYAETTTSNGVK